MPDEDDPSSRASEASPYGLTVKQLMTSMELRGEEALQEYEKLGKAKGVAEKLKTSTEKGISGEKTELEQRKKAFGANFIPPKEPKTFWELCVATLSDFTLQILIVCAAISMFLAIFNMITTADCSDNTEQKQCRPVPADHSGGGGSHRSLFTIFGLKFNLASGVSKNLSKYASISRNLFLAEASSKSGGDFCDPNAKFLEKYIDFIDGGMIIATIAIVILVTAYQDYTKEKQFRGLQDRLCNEQKATVVRNGECIEIVVAELVVGDIANVKYGDLLPADGILVDSSELKVDESSLTGESDHVKKGVDKDPFLLGGTHVMEGSGKMIVTAVGPSSQSGIIMTLLGASADTEENNDAPAKHDLENQAVSDEPDVAAAEVAVSSGEGSILQQKLDALTELIGVIGAFACFLTIGILLIRMLIEFFFIAEKYDTTLAIDPEAPGTFLPQKNLTAENQIQPNEIWPMKYCWLFYITEILGFLIIGVTVLVVAIPEGLPLAVTITLGYSMGKMMKDNNLVRHLDSCETMGNATAICSDKTGTLTTNRMTVVQSFMAEKFYKDCKPNPAALSKTIASVLFQGIAVNTAYTSQVVPDENGGQDQQLGNKTECALLGFSNELAKHGGPDFTNMKYEALRQATPDSKFLKVYTFNSARKSMTTIIANPDDKSGQTLRVFSKGASEIICGRCTSILNENGAAVPIEKLRENLKTEVIEKMASEAMRTIGLAYKDIPANSDLEDENAILSNLTLIAIVGIEDPVRPEVPGAIQQCQQAGITVRMVTGDNVMTARSIATKCGIIADPNDPNALVIDGKEFNNMIKDADGKILQERIDEIWPKLRVLARSSPTDKYTLVKGMIESNVSSEGLQVVAVTGDGTNDGPALKKADVGFAMGIAGTDVAKEASDIILMDDNFSSIVKAVMWGRNVYDSISKFLQFQLTVNVTAILCAVVGAAYLGASPLSAVQMLWVNLIMDSFAALALATEIPTPELLTRKPYPRNKSLISQIMFKNIMFHAIYQFIIVILALVAPTKLLPCNDMIKQSELDAGRPSQCAHEGTIWGVLDSKDYEYSTGVSAKRFPTEQFTLVFNLFVCMQLFNQLNARKIHGEFNIFNGIANNSMFLVILLIEFLGQVFIVEVAQVMFGCASLSFKQWLFCLAVGATELIVGQIITALPVGWVDPFIALFVRNNQVSTSNVDINAESQVNFSESYTSRFGSAHSGRRNSRYLWYRGYNRVTEQIQLAKRYSIAPGELSVHDLCSLRDSNVSLTMTNVKEKRRIMSRNGKRLRNSGEMPN